MKTYYDRDADLSALKGKKIAVIGFGSEGHAHALNLRDSGMDVCVGLSASSPSREKATKQGLPVFDTAEAAKRADVIMMLVPDEMGAEIYAAEIAPISPRASTWPSVTASTSISNSSSRPPTSMSS